MNHSPPSWAILTAAELIFGTGRGHSVQALAILYLECLAHRRNHSVRLRVILPPAVGVQYIAHRSPRMFTTATLADRGGWAEPRLRPERHEWHCCILRSIEADRVDREPTVSEPEYLTSQSNLHTPIMCLPKHSPSPQPLYHWATWIDHNFHMRCSAGISGVRMGADKRHVTNNCSQSQPIARTLIRNP